MDKRYKYQNRIAMTVCLCILGFMLAATGIRLFTRNILMWRFNVNNGFTKAVFFDNVTGTGELKEPNEWIFHDDFVVTAMKYDKLIGWEEPLSPDDWTRIIKMNNGYLAYIQPKLEDADIEDLADHVKYFADEMAKRDIPFYYINMGSKVCPEDKQISDYETNFEYTNENGDALIKACRERGVNVVDMREKLLKSGRDWYESFYITDHHWTNRTGLWAAGYIANMLNEEAGFSFDLSKFEEDSYNITRYEDCMMGGLGRTVTLVNAKAEPFDVIIPNFDTDITYDIVSEDRSYEGPYEKAIFDEDKLNAVLNFKGNDYLNLPDAYNTTHINNYMHSIMTNNLECSNEGKRILMLEDSYSWYLTSYLALDTECIDIIYPIDYKDSLVAYVDETKPDAVIFSCCEKAINPIDYENGMGYFYLR